MVHIPSTADIASRIGAVLAGARDQPAIEFRDRWHTWGDLKRYADAIEQLLSAAQIPIDAPIGLVARTRIPHAGGILGLVALGRTVSMIYAYQSAQAIAADLTALRLRAVIADAEDWNETTIDAARQAGSLGIALSLDQACAVYLVPGLEKPGKGPFRNSTTVPGIELLSSGTTGPPKRILVPRTALSRSVMSMAVGMAAGAAVPPTVQFWPLGTIAVGGLIARACMGSRLVLLEKFVLEDWLRAIRKYRPVSASGPPPVIRQVLAAAVPREDLASIQYFSGGSGALEPEIQDRFEQIYGIPILWGYGATEFAGSVANWTPDLRRQFEGRKRGSVGQPLPGTEVRIVDAASGRALPPGEPGRLEARIDVLGEQWIRTTDIASLDEDNFLFIHGRDDGAIVRGGFKILPERVAEALRRHPDVLDAAVVGIPDRILGQVPAAAVEARPGRPLSVAALAAHVRATLPSHHVPKRFVIVDELPRTATLKVDLRAVSRLFDPT